MKVELGAQTSGLKDEMDNEKLVCKRAENLHPHENLNMDIHSILYYLKHVFI